MQIEPIIWDSEFFQLKIGKTEPNEFNAAHFKNEKNKFDLIYLFEHPDAALNKEIIDAGAVLVDVKRTYKKILSKDSSFDEHISIYPALTPNDKLTELALQSGIYSRFKIDAHFNAGVYEKLYTEWIKKSCNKDIAFCVLVYGNQSCPDGFITVSKKNEEAQIGLIAVDEKARGKGIGKKLITAAEFIAENHNFETLKVVTQSANSEACILYEKSGFVVDESINIYHYWNSENAHTL